ncbi:unnamed protein product, partial [Ascophyllum nodosum]
MSELVGMLRQLTTETRTAGKTARRGRATSYPDVTGAQVTVMR